ncbi:MAG: hypothetical protein GYB67_08440 [Chloroflexi bacterium]|nr:hypothetical protein [Chloroflexota bacterium]
MPRRLVLLTLTVPLFATLLITPVFAQPDGPLDDVDGDTMRALLFGHLLTFER